MNSSCVVGFIQFNNMGMLRLIIFLKKLGDPCRNTAITFGVEQIRMVWLTDGEKNRI